MSMDLGATYEALQNVHAAITGIKTAPYDRPAALQTAQLPCVLTWLAPGEWNIYSHGHQGMLREWIARCYYLPFGQGPWLAPAHDMLDLLALFPRAYFSDTNIRLGGVVDHIQSCRDNGDDGLLVYNGTLYYGFEFRVKILERGTI